MWVQQCVNECGIFINRKVGDIMPVEVFVRLSVKHEPQIPWWFFSLPMRCSLFFSQSNQLINFLMVWPFIIFSFISSLDFCQAPPSAKPLLVWPFVHLLLISPKMNLYPQSPFLSRHFAHSVAWFVSYLGWQVDTSLLPEHIVTRAVNCRILQAQNLKNENEKIKWY